MPLRPTHFRVALTSALALVLAGCRDEVRPDVAPEPMFVPAAGAELYDLQPAPAWEELPPAPPAPIGRPVAYDEGYGYAERAYAMDRAFYDVPPDYGFAYEDADPWVWRTDDDYMLFVEPVSGGYRRYYYEPGADYPYFIRDPDYGYGFDRGGVLVTVYNPSGVLLPYDYLDDGAIRAGRYRGRGRVLYETAVYERRLPIVREAWLSRRPTLVASQRPWMEAAVRQKDWRKYRERHEHREIRHFVGERERRKAVIARAERQDFRQAAARAHDVRESRREERWKRSDERERRAERKAPRLEHAVHEERGRSERSERPERPARVPERPARVNVERPRADQARPAREARPERVARAEARKEARPARVEPRRDEQVKIAAPSRPERAARPHGRQEDRRPDRVERRAPKPEAAQRRVERPARAERAERERPGRAELRAEAPARAKPQARQRAERPEAPARGGERGGERGGKSPKG